MSPAPDRISDERLADWLGYVVRAHLGINNYAWLSVPVDRVDDVTDALRELQDWRSGKLRLPTLPPVDREAERRLLARQHAAQAFGGEVEGE